MSSTDRVSTSDGPSLSRSPARARRSPQSPERRDPRAHSVRRGTVHIRARQCPPIMSPRRRSTAESGVAAMLKRLTLTAALCACAGTAMAERMYVTDSLRLGLYRSEDTNDKPLVNLMSGAQVDVLERNASLARVRTPSGDEGWVKAAFLVPEKPAQLRVAELEAELAGLRNEAAEPHGTHAVDETADRIARPTVAS